MRQVYLAADPIQAEIIKDYLAGHGIEAVVQGAMLWGGRGDLPLDAYPSIWVVRDAQAERARRLVMDWERRDPDADEWHCPRCGEPLPGEFTLCWRCAGQAETDS